jgi:hypothetical protein
MEIDRNHLPEDPAVLRKMVVGLLEDLDLCGRCQASLHRLRLHAQSQSGRAGKINKGTQ